MNEIAHGLLVADIARAGKTGAPLVRDVVFDILRSHSMTTIFGNPGSTELPLFTDLPADFRYVLGLQESLVVAMADGFAQASRGPAFVNLHSAAGVGHAMGAIYTAFRNRSPLVITAGQQSRSMLSADPFLFSDAPTHLPHPYVKWAIEPARAEDVPAALARACQMALLPPYGPTLVSIPLDDWSVPGERLAARAVSGRSSGDPAMLDAIAARLDAARNPAFVVGPGVDIDDAWEEAVRLAEFHQAAVWVSPLSSRASFPERHPLFAGFLTAQRQALAKALTPHDVIVVLGAPVFTYHFEGEGDYIAPGAELFQIVDDPQQAAGAVVGTAVLSDLKLALPRLLDASSRRREMRGRPLRRIARLPQRDGISPAFVMQAVADTRPQDSIVVEESPGSRGVMHDHLPIERPGTFFATASGGLGYGVPASVGVALARPGQRVVALLGDGSSMYSIQAIWTAVEHHADITFIVLNNGGYGVLKEIAEGAPLHGCDIGHLDLVALAMGQGCPAERISHAADLAPALQSAFARKGPRLLEIMIDEDDAMNVHTEAATPAIKVPDRFFIDGEWVEPLSDTKVELVAPATGEALFSYPDASTADVDRAVSAARKAFDEGEWPRMPAAERAVYMKKIAEAMRARLPDFAHAWTTQVGAPISLTTKLIGQGPQLFDFYAGVIEEFDFVEERKRADGGRVRIAREAVGVVAAITPWNAPLVLLCYKVAAALAAGCTVVAKPSPETPLEAFILAECIEEAGLPRGVFNLVPAGREVGDHLVRHAQVDKISFTGSTAAGKHIAAVASERLARVSLELGGKSAAILLDDADFKAALPSLMVYSMPITGQVCFSLTRILVPESRKQEFLDLFLAAVDQIKVGDPFDPATQMGPLTMERQLTRVRDYIESGKQSGAKLMRGGGTPKNISRGFFVEPTVFSEVTPDMKIAREEIFGPVVSVIGYTDVDDAVAKANATDYGLSGAIYTADPERGYAVARRIRTGSLTINGMIVDITMPFGGFKQSGMGREGGLEGLDEYLEVKTIHYA